MSIQAGVIANMHGRGPDPIKHFSNVHNARGAAIRNAASRERKIVKNVRRKVEGMSFGFNRKKSADSTAHAGTADKRKYIADRQRYIRKHKVVGGILNALHHPKKWE